MIAVQAPFIERAGFACILTLIVSRGNATASPSTAEKDPGKRYCGVNVDVEVGLLIFILIYVYKVL